MGFADRLLNRSLALTVPFVSRALPTTVSPVMPSTAACLSNLRVGISCVVQMCRLLAVVPLLPDVTFPAGYAAMKSLRYSRSCASSAQTILAFLFAKATAPTFRFRRSHNLDNHVWRSVHCVVR